MQLFAVWTTVYRGTGALGVQLAHGTLGGGGGTILFHRPVAYL